jgi:hypothetical protein
MTKTRRQVTVVLLAAAAVLATIVAVSPHTTVTTSEISGEVYGIDILGISKNAKDLPDQQFAAF